jgi:hypothetical protein
MDRTSSENAGRLSDGGRQDLELVPLERRVEELETVLYEIALMADRHKSSRLYVDGQNVALTNIRNMAAFAVGLEERLRDYGTLSAPTPGYPGTVT